MEYFAREKKTSEAQIIERLRVIVAAHMKNLEYFSMLILLEVFRFAFLGQIDALKSEIATVKSSDSPSKIARAAPEE